MIRKVPYHDHDTEAGPSMPSRVFFHFRKPRAWFHCLAYWLGPVIVLLALPLISQSQGETTAFAVISETPKDKSRVSAKVLIDGTITDLKLLPNETVGSNPIWRALEICHAVKVEGSKAADGFKINSVRVLDAGMLPMALQGFAGDCLIKKAVEVAPLVD
jgi:hypothetical protein